MWRPLLSEYGIAGREIINGERYDFEKSKPQIEDFMRQQITDEHGMITVRQRKLDRIVETDYHEARMRHALLRQQYEQSVAKLFNSIVSTISEPILTKIQNDKEKYETALLQNDCLTIWSMARDATLDYIEYSGQRNFSRLLLAKYDEGKNTAEEFLNSLEIRFEESEYAGYPLTDRQKAVLLRDAFSRRDFFHAIPRLWTMKQREEGYPTYEEAVKALRKFQEPVMNAVKKERKRKVDSGVEFVQNDLKDALHETSKALNVSVHPTNEPLTHGKKAKIDPLEWKKHVRCHRCGRKGHIKSECTAKTGDKKDDHANSHKRTDDGRKNHHFVKKQRPVQGKGRPRTTGLMARLQRDAETEAVESEQDWKEDGPLSYKTVLCKGDTSRTLPSSSCEESCSDDEDWDCARAFTATAKSINDDKWELVRNKRAKRAAQKRKNSFRRSRFGISDLRARMQEKRISLGNSASMSPTIDVCSKETERFKGLDEDNVLAKQLPMEHLQSVETENQQTWTSENNDSKYCDWSTLDHADIANEYVQLTSVSRSYLRVTAAELYWIRVLSYLDVLRRPSVLYSERQLFFVGNGSRMQERAKRLFETELNGDYHLLLVLFELVGGCATLKQDIGPPPPLHSVQVRKMEEQLMVQYQYVKQTQNELRRSSRPVQPVTDRFRESEYSIPRGIISKTHRPVNLPVFPLTEHHKTGLPKPDRLKRSKKHPFSVKHPGWIPDVSVKHLKAALKEVTTQKERGRLIYSTLRSCNQRPPGKSASLVSHCLWNAMQYMPPEYLQEFVTAYHWDRAREYEVNEMIDTAHRTIWSRMIVGQTLRQERLEQQERNDESDDDVEDAEQSDAASESTEDSQEEDYPCEDPKVSSSDEEDCKDGTALMIGGGNSVSDKQLPCFDTGATHHLHKTAGELQRFLKPNLKGWDVKAADGSGMVITHYGTVPGYGKVLIVPTVSQVLISVIQLSQNGMKVLFDEDQATVIRPGKPDMICPINSENPGQYILSVSQWKILQGVEQPKAFTAGIALLEQTRLTAEQLDRIRQVQLLHEWTGHCPYNMLEAALRNGIITDTKLVAQDIKTTLKYMGPCPQCMQGSVTSPSFGPSSRPPAENIGDVVHFDILELRREELGNGRYVIFAADEKSNYQFVQIIDSKHVSAIKNALSIIVGKFRLYNHTVRAFQCDHEATLKACEEYLNNKGIELRMVPPLQHAQRIERQVRTLRSRVRSLLASTPTKIPTNVIGDAYSTVVHMINNLPSTKCPTESPAMSFKGRRFQLRDKLIVPFGTWIMAHCARKDAPKNDPRSRLALALGPCEQTDRAINVFYPSTMGHGVCSDFTVLHNIPTDCPYPVNTSYSPLGNRFRQQLAATLYKRGARNQHNSNPLSNTNTAQLFGGQLPDTTVTSTTTSTPENEDSFDLAESMDLDE